MSQTRCCLFLLRACVCCARARVRCACGYVNETTGARKPMLRCQLKVSRWFAKVALGQAGGRASEVDMPGPRPRISAESQREL
eukprot:2628127-Rhodomonas_salina.2